MYLSNCKTNLDALKQVTSHIEYELDLMKSKLDEVIPKPKKYVDYPSTNNYKCSNGSTIACNVTSLFTFKDYWGNSIDPTTEQLEKRKIEILELLKKYEEDCKPITDQNKTIDEHNKLVKTKIGDIMRELGVPSYYTTHEYKTSRSTKKTSTTHTAGYIGDLGRLVGSAPSPRINVESVRSQVEDHFKRKMQEAVARQRAEEKVRKEKEVVHTLALLRAKYTPDEALSEPEDIIQGILAQDKYLRLAHYLEANRNDWSDGYSYAEQGLELFVVETEEDKEIFKRLKFNIEDDKVSGNIDGRTFRDCSPTYSEIYAKADQKLLVDLEKVKAMSDYY